MTYYCFFSGFGGPAPECVAEEDRRCPDEDTSLMVRYRYDENGRQMVGEPFCSRAPDALSAPSQNSAESDPLSQSPGQDDLPAAFPAAGLNESELIALGAKPALIHAPGRGLGLRNAHTTFYAEVEGQRLATQILGLEGALELYPVAYIWDYGDGTPPVTTYVPGYAPTEFNEETPTSHVYEETGTFDVTLTTVFRASFAVDGGPFIPVPGQLELTSEPAVADIWRTTTRNVLETCTENPRGWACESMFLEDTEQTR